MKLELNKPKMAALRSIESVSSITVALITMAAIAVAALLPTMLVLHTFASEAAADEPRAVATLDLEAAIADGPGLGVDEAAERALASSPSIERARALKRASAAALSRAQAAIWPRLELSAQYMRVDGFEDGAIETGRDPDELAAAQMLAAQVSDPAARLLWLATLDSQASSSVSIAIPRNRFGVGARVQWPVSDLFFAMLPAIDAARAGTRARDAQVAVIHAEVRLQAQQAYYLLARARGALAVAEEAERLATGQLEQIAAAARVGLLTRADELGAKAHIAEARQAVVAARAGVETADAALRLLIGAEDGPVFGMRGLVQGEGAIPPKRDELLAQALRQRPELDALRASLEAARASRRASRATGAPHLIVFAGAEYANPNRYQIPPQQEFTPSWEVGAALTWSPNDLVRSTHRDGELGAEIDALESQLAELERGVRLEVYRAHADLNAARESIATADAAQEAAEAAYESRLVQLRAGRTTTAELFTAEAQLSAARLSVLGSNVALRLAEARLERALGSARSEHGNGGAD